jgi:glycine cleavage system H protein
MTTFFTSEHVWIRLTPDDPAVATGTMSGTVGITRFAQDSLGDIVFVGLPKVGTQTSRGQASCVVESTKTAADVIDPAGGEVTNVNSDLESNVTPLNDDPLGSGWLYRVSFQRLDPDEVGWMDEAAYQAFCGA